MSERTRALAYVTSLVQKYRDKFPTVPRYQEAFFRNRVTALTRDLEVLRAAGEDGDALARGWCRVAVL